MVLLWLWGQSFHLAVALAALFLPGASLFLTLTLVTFGCADPKKAAKDPKLGQSKAPPETPRTSSENKPNQPATPNPPSPAADIAVDKTQQPTSNDDAKPTASVKTGLPASANTGKAHTEDSFKYRKPEYKEAKAADKVREHGPVPKNEKGYATMDDIGTSNFGSVPTSNARSAR
ncbi:hypothetical protein AAVH_08799 [Aphelenchoides avenae]|nr:hypothetical protein AAVH_08799 [Aphelenchus avenae]